MIFLPLLEHPPGPALDGLRAQALASAIVLRNCALHLETCAAGRRACRSLMRGQAIQWRLPLVPYRQQI